MILGVYKKQDRICSICSKLTWESSGESGFKAAEEVVRTLGGGSFISSRIGPGLSSRGLLCSVLQVTTEVKKATTHLGSVQCSFLLSTLSVA